MGIGDRGFSSAPVTSDLQPMYGIVVAMNIMVPMRDDVRLATDVYRPAWNGEPVSGKWPTVLARFGYDKGSHFSIQALVERFVPEGYVVVVQDIRGRFRSEGQYYHTISEQEGPDGYDTVEWIADQSWSNGRIATVGGSLGAMVQSALALYSPPHLSAMFLEDGPLNCFTNGIRQGGALELRTLAWCFYPAINCREARENPVVGRRLEYGLAHLRDLLMQLPLKPGGTPLAAVPRFEQEFFDYYTRGEHSDYWEQDCINYDDMERHADVPVIIRCGWYDSYALGMHQYYGRLVENKRSPVRLIYGPWVHGGAASTHAGDVYFGPEAALDINELRLRYFDRFLKDSANAVDEEPPVRIFVMGGGDGRRNGEGRLNHGGQWRYEWEWPLARTHFASYYLRNGGLLSTESPEVSDPSASFAYDPHHPVPTISAPASGFWELLPAPEGVMPEYVPTRGRMRQIVALGGSHQKEAPHIFGSRPPYPPLAARRDVLVFQTPPLARDVEVTGPISVKLWVSSSALDTDFTAKLIDVYPPTEDLEEGYALNLADSICRMRYRNGYESAELMEPDSVNQAKIELPPTSNLFKVGHRIRVDVSSSNFPRFDPNPNTGEPLGRHTYTAKAHNTVYMDESRPSHIVLPIIPRD